MPLFLPLVAVVAAGARHDRVASATHLGHDLRHHVHPRARRAAAPAARSRAVCAGARRLARWRAPARRLRLGLAQP